MHDLVRSYSLAIARRVRHARQECTQAEEVLSKQSLLAGPPPALLAAPYQVEGRRAAVQRWEGVHSPYRHHLAVRSLTLHPLPIDDSTPQTAAQVHRRLEAAVAASAT
jgi:hypothetical protein